MLLAAYDPSSLITVVSGIITLLTPICLGIWRGVVLLISYFKPLLSETFANHNKMVTTITAEGPKVTAAIEQLAQTQDGQCKTLEQHTEHHRTTHTKLEELLDHIRKSNPQIPTNP